MDRKASVKQRALRGVLATGLLTAAVAQAQQFPATTISQGELVSLTQANNAYGTTTSRTYYIPSVNADAQANIRPVQIRVLAKGLGAQDARDGRISEEEYAARAYEYVRQNLQPVFMYGEQKGALGALLDQAGTAFDQSSLLVALLREGGITSLSYQLGTITLSNTAINPSTGLPLNQFYDWTGITDGTAACRLLADGGIPAEINGVSNANCSGTSGPINSVKVRHAWVTASVRKSDGSSTVKTFDPAYKRQIWGSGIDLAAALGCGSGGTSTCYNTLFGYLPAQTTVGGAPALQNINTPNLENAFNGYAVALLNNLRGRSPDLNLQETVGGGRIDLDSFTPATASLPYVTSDVITVSEIPNQYRILVRVQFGLIDKQMFADELAGKRLRILGDTGLDVNGHTAAPLQVTLYAEYEMLASNNNQITQVGTNPLTLTVNHPYAAQGGTMQDVSTVFETHSFLDDTLPGQTSAIGFRFDNITIMTAFGPTGQGTSGWFSDLQNKNLYVLDITDKTNPAHTWGKGQPYPCGGPDNANVDEGGPFNAGCLRLSQASIGANWLAQNEKLVDLVGRVNNTHVLTHHIIGFVKSGAVDPPLMSFDSSYALASRTNATLDRRSSSFAISSMSSRLEGTMTEQVQKSPVGMSGPSVLDMFNERGIALVYATQSNFTALRGSLQEYPTWLLDRIRDTYLANGYNVLLPREWELGFYHTPGMSDETGIEFKFGAFFAFQSSGAKSAYIVAWGLKGTGGQGLFDPSGEILDSLQSRDSSLKSPSYHKVDLQNGALTLTPPPDLVTGPGPFPMSLSFQRTYNSADTGLPTDVHTRNTKAGRSVRHWDPGTTLRYGWKHNFDIRANLGSNYYRSMGENTAIDGSIAIATIYLLRDLHQNASTFSSEVVSTYLANWWGKRLFNNEFSIEVGAKRTSYLRLADDSYVSNENDGSKLTRTGNDSLGWYVYPDVNYGSLRWELTNVDGSKLNIINDGLYTWQGTEYRHGDNRRYYPKTWTFPSGIVVNFKYANLNPVSGPETEYNHWNYCLQEVSNTLGRKIIFNFASDQRVEEGACVIQSVTDENNRSVQFEDSEEDGGRATFNPIDHTFTVTLPDNSKVNYHYRSTTDEPGTARAVNVIDAWSFGDSPENFAEVQYDELFRVSAISIAPNNDGGVRSVSNFRVGGLSIGENLRRGELRTPTGGVTTHYFNRAGLDVLSTDPLGYSTWNVYDSLNRLKKTIRPELDSTEFEYDVRGNTTKVTQHPKPNSPFPDRVTSTQYTEGATVRICTTSACNKPASTTDAAGRITTTEYNTDGQPRRIRKPAVTAGTGETNYCYTVLNGMNFLTGRVDVTSTTPAKPNRVKTFGYDPSQKFVLNVTTVDPKASLGTDCSAVSKSTGLDRVRRLTYDAVGNVRTLDGPRTDVNDIKTYTFDEMRRVKEVDLQSGSDSQYAVTQYQYYPDGALWTVSKKDENAVWRTETRTYWPSGELRTVQDAEGDISRYVYDLAGNTTAEIDPEQRAVASVFDVAGRTVCTWQGADPASLPANCDWTPSSFTGTGPVRNSANTYSPNGQRTGVTDAKGNTTQFVFDGHNRQRFTFYPNSADGTRCRLASSGQADIDNGPVTCPASGGTTPTYEQLSYTASGSPTGALCSGDNRVCRKRTRAGQTITYGYDALDRKTTRTAAGIPAATYKFNLLGEMTSATSPAGTVNSVSVPAHSTTYDYDDAGGLKYEENTIAGGRLRRVSYQYDEAGNRSRTTWHDGYYVTYWYDELRRLTYVRENSTTTNELARYQYDPISRRKEIRYAGVVTNAQSYTYEPDSDLDLLTSIQNAELVTLDYDSNGSGQINGVNASDGFYLGMGSLQVGQTNYTPNSLNQYSSIEFPGSGAASLSNETNGNLTGWGPTATRSTYTYDSENRLRRAVVTGGSTTDYDYDPLDRRISKKVGSTFTYYQLDGMEEIAEYDASGVVLRRYITGPAIDERIATVFGSATTTPPKTYFHFNHQGSVQATTDSTGNATGCQAGLVCQKFAYDPYGNLATGSSTTGQPFRYAGRRFDEETGLYYYRARYYAPQLGRFLQTDPVGYQTDFNLHANANNENLNLYSYVEEDPLNATDPTGERTYVVNRQLAAVGGMSPFSGTSRYRANPLTHTFTVVTGPDGIHTYSWGAASGGWSKDLPVDLKAAEEALASGEAESVDDSPYATLDPYVEVAFNQLSGPGSVHFNGWIFYNCKTETSNLIGRAKDLRARDRADLTRLSAGVYNFMFPHVEITDIIPLRCDAGGGNCVPWMP